jgi:hypothetical protein
MRVWHDKWNALFKKQDIAQECSAPASITQHLLDYLRLSFHHIYIRQIDTPT